MVADEVGVAELVVGEEGPADPEEGREVDVRRATLPAKSTH